MNIRLITRALSAAIGLGVAAAAWAADPDPYLYVSVGGQGEMSFEASSLLGVAKTGNSPAFFEDGTWTTPCAVGPSGQFCDGTSIGVAQGEVFSDLGRFRSYTSVHASEVGFLSVVKMTQFDVVSFLPYQNTPKLNLHIDADSLTGSAPSTNRANNHFSMSVLFEPLDCKSGECGFKVFQFNLRDYEGTDLDQWSYSDWQGPNNTPPEGKGTRLPQGGLDISVDIRDDNGVAPAPFSKFALTLRIEAESACDNPAAGVNSFCTARLDASKTVYVGITDLESSTYSYPGAAAAVPEPGSWALMFVGLGLVGAMGARRKNA